MPDVNLQLVREFFELNMYRVLTNWQGDQSFQLVVENTNPSRGPDGEFVLRPADLSAIERALVEVRAWHAERFYPSVIESNPILYQFVNENALAKEVFGNQPFKSILVISELPASPNQRAQAAKLLEDAGVDHIIEFATILQDLLNKISINTTYSGSQTLQTLRLLKRYRLMRHQQMEFPFPTEPPVSLPPKAGTTENPPE